MRQLFFRLLEDRYFNRLPEEWVLRSAQESVDFVRFWLVHCFRSAASERELATVLFFAAKWKLEELTFLRSFWQSYTSVMDEAAELTLRNLYFQLIPQINLDHDNHLDAIAIFSFVLKFEQQTVVSELQQGVASSYRTCLPIEMLQEIQTLSLPHLHPITVYGHQGKGSVEFDIRNNTHFPTQIPNASLVFACVERVVAHYSGTNLAFAEPMVVLRYEVGQFYKWHYDAIHAHTPTIESELKQFGQRNRTAILYLNDDFTGGETEFKAPYIQVHPKAGSVLVFDNVDCNGRTLISSLHRGCEVSTGQKWICTQWFRDKPFWLRSGLLT